MFVLLLIVVAVVVVDWMPQPAVNNRMYQFEQQLPAVHLPMKMLNWFQSQVKMNKFIKCEIHWFILLPCWSNSISTIWFLRTNIKIVRITSVCLCVNALIHSSNSISKHIKLDWNVKHWLLHDFLNVFWLIIVNVGCHGNWNGDFSGERGKRAAKAKKWIIIIVFEMAIRIRWIIV